MSVVKIVLAVLSHLRRLMPLPDIDDEAACRAWVGELMKILGELATETVMTLDDALASGLAAVLADDKAWALLYKTIHDLVCREDHAGPVLGDGTPAHAAATQIAGVVGISPMVILMIIQVIVAVIKFVIDLRKRPDPNE